MPQKLFTMGAENPSDPHRLHKDQHDRPHILLELDDLFHHPQTTGIQREGTAQLMGTLTRNLNLKAMRVLRTRPNNPTVEETLNA